MRVVLIGSMFCINPFIYDIKNNILQQYVLETYNKEVV